MHGLHNDLIDRLLTFSPDFQTLGAAILTTRSFYEIFKAHPASILRAVAANETKAFGAAIRLVRFIPGQHLSEILPENAPDVAESDLLTDDLRKLREYAQEAKEWEDLFSIRCVSTKRIEFIF
jgi:hypothetical protein